MTDPQTNGGCPNPRSQDMEIADVDSIGGVPVADLQKAARSKQVEQVKRLYAFPSEDGPMPDDAPAAIAKVQACSTFLRVLQARIEATCLSEPVSKA